MNSDFCKLQNCTCKDNCTDHLTFPEHQISEETHSDTTPNITTSHIHALKHIPQQSNNVTTIQIRKAQNDIGANASVTNNKSSILLYQDIAPYAVSGIQKDDPAITCTGKGYLLWKSKSGTNLLVPIYYCAQADGTIISPQSIQSLYSDIYNGFHMFCDCDNKTGHLQFYNRNGIDHAIFDAYSTNNLWYHDMSKPTNSTSSSSQPPSTHQTFIHPSIKRLNKIAQHELWHQRLILPGEQCMCTIHKHVDGIDAPLIGNCFYSCAACMHGKPRKSNRYPPCHDKHKRKKYRTAKHKVTTPSSPSDDLDDDNMHIPNSLPGQHFRMDFGFVRGSQYSIKQEDNPTITSKDGYNSYLIIVDRASRYSWIFLTKSKQPPIALARKVLSKFKSTNPHRTVRTDQGGELGRSEKFSKMVDDEGFVLELTGAEASKQNGIAESPNRVYAQMMRCALYSSGLGPEYWSYALRMSVYVKNRLPHKSISCTPFQKLTGKKPDVSKLRIFGSRVCARIPGASKFPKLDQKNTNGIFLGYTATDKNIYFEDDTTQKVLISTHALFDEAHLSVANNSAPLGSQALQRTGYSPEDDRDETKPIQFKLLTSNATSPSISTKESIGIDLHSASNDPIVIEPNSIGTIPTDIAMEPPPGTYVRIASRSGLSFKYNLHVVGGVIDPDYRGNVKVGLINHGNTSYTINKGDRIAQAILEKAHTPTIAIVDNLSTTDRNVQGFGSTEARNTHTSNKSPSSTPTTKSHSTSPLSIPTPNPELLLSTTFNHIDNPPKPYPPTITPENSDNEDDVAKVCSMHTDISLPYHLTFSNDPFDNTITIPIAIKGTNPCLGLHLRENNEFGRLQLLDCTPSTPAARIPRWRSTLRNGFVTKYNDTVVSSVDQLKTLITISRDKGDKMAYITFSTIERQAMHPIYGVPQLQHDQLNIIAQHLQDIKEQTNMQRFINENDNVNLTINKLTRKMLKNADDWPEWKASEFKQLDMYEEQDTFGPPCELPPGANVLNLLWTYRFKEHENRRKARCVCNGAKNRRGCVTMAETFASSLEQTGSRIFWATSAMNNYIVVGADASNAFAEAPPPKAPLYVYIDTQFREWWEEKGYAPLHPSQKVMRVKKALQGHPESPRLWTILIDKIIQDLGFKPCHHEPCLYVNTNYNGEKVYFLRQVDDFAISARTEAIANEVINKINSKLSIDIKPLGIINRFNGVDIQQSRHFIKLYNKTYIRKILRDKNWLNASIPGNHTKYLPMHNDRTYNKSIETSDPISPSELPSVEKEFGFTYKQGIGELIYAMVTCRPDISYPLIKLSQYSTKPARIHFEAVQSMYQYLKDTIDEGIHYWRKEPREDCPIDPVPQPRTDYTNYTPHASKSTAQPSKYSVQVDASYSNDTTHRKSVTGIIGRLAGGTISYKTKFQDIIALSSTEAEFIAACDAGKNCLYIRSILEDLGIPQEEATLIYEDNKAAIAMANAGRPTKRTKHIDTRYFALQSWVEQDLVLLKSVPTSDNSSDALTKNVPRLLFNRHMDFILGKTIPEYATFRHDIQYSYAQTSDVLSKGG